MARITGDNRDETLTGTESADTIDGHGGDDTINAGGGNDIIVIGGGTDRIDGGDGIDRIRFDQTTYPESSEPDPKPGLFGPYPVGLAWDDGLFIDLVTGETSLVFDGDVSDRLRFGTIRVQNVEEYEMTRHDDQFLGSSNGERVLAGAGDDVLDGRGGDDRLEGGSGDDVIFGGDGNDRLLAGSGADYMDGGFGADVIDGGDLAANFYDGLVNAGIFTRAQANAALAAENDHDTVSYANSFSGVDVDFERSVQQGGDADGDRISGVENIDGSTRDDFLRGDDKANVIFGNRGADVLEGRGGADTLEGGTGLDTAAYDSSSSRVVVDLLAATQSGGDAQGDTLDSIENLRGSAFDDTLRGDDSTTANRIFGGAGRDTIDGRGGNDVIDGGVGNDTIDGGTGNDFADFQSWNDLQLSRLFTRTEINLAEGSARRFEFSAQTRSFLTTETDQLSRIENVNGSVYNDTIIGNALDNKLFGNDGNDTLSGDDGNDVLIGAAGNDTFDGGFGNDQLLGGDGIDIADFSSWNGESGRATFRLGLNGADGTAERDVRNTSTFSFQTVETDTLSAIERIIGTTSQDIFFGNEQDNTFEGREGLDTFNTDLGRDIYDGGVGTDTVDYSQSSATVGITVSIDSGLRGVGGFAEGDVLFGIENVIGTNGNDAITGNGDRNVLTGGGGDDTLEGGGGDDRLIGGTEIDIEALTGGAGRDTFVYTSRADSFTTLTHTGDVILDFNTDEDLIDLRALHVNAANLRLDDSGVGSSGRQGHLFEDLNGNNTFDANELNINIVLSGSAEFSLQDVLV